MTFPWLTVLGLLPLLGALVLALPVRAAARGIGMGFALATLAAAGADAVLFVNGADLAVRLPWIPAFWAWWAPYSGRKTSS